MHNKCKTNSLAVTDQVTVMTILQITVVEYAGYILNKALVSVSHKNITKPCTRL